MRDSLTDRSVLKVRFATPRGTIRGHDHDMRCRFRSSFAALCFVATVAIACGPSLGPLDELPLASSRIQRNGILRTVAVSQHEAWILHRVPRSGASAGADVTHWDGRTLTFFDLPEEAEATSIALVGSGHVVIGGTHVLEIQGGVVRDITEQTAGSVRFLVAGRGDGVVYALGTGVLLRRGPGETMFRQIPPPPGGLNELVVAGPDRLIGVGDGNGTQADVIYHFDGTDWRPSMPPQTGRLLSAAAADDAWALPLPTSAGTPLDALAFDGTQWRTVPIRVRTELRDNNPGMLTVYGIVALGGGRAGAVVLRRYATHPPRHEILWITGTREALDRQSVVRVFCQTPGCTDGGDFTGPPALAPDGTLYVGPYVGRVPLP